MKKILKETIALSLALVTMLSLTGCRIGNTEFVFREDEENPNILFTFNEEECMLPEAMIYLCNYKSLYGNIFDLDLWNGSFDEDRLETYVKDVSLEEIELVYCIAGLAESQGLTLSEKETSQVSDMAKEYYDSLSADEIAFMNLTEADVVTAYSRYALAQKLYGSMTAGYDEEVSDDEARVILIEQIYVSSEDSADSVEEKLSGGEDFSTVAATYNEAGSIEEYVARGDLPQTVENVAFDLNDGETSGKIETDEGYYFIYCESKFVEDLTEANKEVLKVEKQKAEFDSSFDEFASDSTFHFNQELWDSLTIKDTDFLSTDNFFELYDTYMGE